jgi:hypothetical protein
MVKLSDDQKWYRVSLRLMGDGLPIDEVETRLGISPSQYGHKGDPLRHGGRYESNVWVFSNNSESDIPFDIQIESLLTMIEPKKDVLKEILKLPGVEGELFLGFGSENGQGGAFFSSGLLLRIAECGLSMDLDLYPPGEPEDSAIK